MGHTLDGFDVGEIALRQVGRLRCGDAVVPDVFVMWPDDTMRELLSEYDFAYWMKRKASCIPVAEPATKQTLADE